MHLTVSFATYPVAVGSNLVVGNHPVAVGSPGVGTLLEKDSLLARTYNRFDIRDTPATMTCEPLRSCTLLGWVAHLLLRWVAHLLLRRIALGGIPLGRITGLAVWADGRYSL